MLELGHHVVGFAVVRLAEAAEDEQPTTSAPDTSTVGGDSSDGIDNDIDNDSGNATSKENDDSPDSE